MKSVRTWWMPLLLGALLMAMLMGATGATPGARPAAAAVSKTLTISAAAFTPMYDSSVTPSPHTKTGDLLMSQLYGSHLNMVAPIQIPSDGTVTIEKLELIAHDSNNSARILLDLYRSNPSKFSAQKKLANIDTGVAWQGGDWVWSQPNVSPRRVKTNNQLWLWLTVEDPTSLWVYGVRIHYHEGK
jgi:hypothetical protein